MIENEELMEKILKTSICFRIEIDKAESLIQELEALQAFFGAKKFEEKYPVLFPLKEWLEVLLSDFYSKHKDEYLKLKKEREDFEARISEVVASKISKMEDKDQSSFTVKCDKCKSKMSFVRYGVTKDLYWCDKCESYFWINPAGPRA